MPGIIEVGMLIDSSDDNKKEKECEKDPGFRGHGVSLKVF
jgi:hypothetical protein